MTQSTQVQSFSTNRGQMSANNVSRDVAGSQRQTARIGAVTALAGSILAFSGAALWAMSGADLDKALAADDMASYLIVAGEKSQMLITNLTLWMVMALLLGAAATAMTTLSVQRPALARLARYSYWVGVPLVLASYVAWLSIVVRLAPDTTPAALLIAEVVGWFATYADWTATILIAGIGPTLLAQAGRKDWVPGWLAGWSILTAIAGLLTAIAMLTGGSGLSTYGFLIIPIGVLWMIAASVVLFRYRGSENEIAA